MRALLVLAVLVASCGDSGALATVVIGGPADDVCELVDRELVESLYGISEFELDPFDVVPSCVVYAEGDGFLAVSWMRPDENVDFDFLRNANDPQAMNEPLDVAGIGDRAFVRLNDAFEDDGVQVVFETGGVLVNVQGPRGADPADPSAEARELAASIAERVRFDLGE